MVLCVLVLNVLFGGRYRNLVVFTIYIGAGFSNVSDWKKGDSL